MMGIQKVGKALSLVESDSWVQKGVQTDGFSSTYLGCFTVSKANALSLNILTGEKGGEGT